MTSIAQAAAASATTTSSTTSASANPNTQIGTNTFLQLMVTQLQHQDPLSPTDSSQYLTQMAQFTALEQETNTATSTAQLATQNTSNEALSLLGKTVSYLDPTGALQTGQVNAIDLTGKTPTLTVGTATGIAPTAVTTVS